MKLKLISSLLAGGILALGGTLDAQESRWSVSGSVGLGTDDLNSITNTGTSWWNVGAYNVNLGYSGQFAGSTVPFRASLGINWLPDGNGSTRNLSDLEWMIEPQQRNLFGVQLATDLFFDSKISDNLKILVGMSINKWTLNYTSTESMEGEWDAGGWEGDGLRHSFSVPGIKLGFRIGLEYQLSDKMSFDVIFQMIEVGHSNMVAKWTESDSQYWDPDGVTPVYGPTAWNPSWLQFGLKYRF